MLDTDSITRQVLHNCDISDARFSGMYSICGLALRLRDLYKWENGLEPWEESDSAEVLSWIGDKEQLWEKFSEYPYEKISVFGNSYDPFDTEQINAVLNNYRLYYGAGYAHSLKPAFFLAEIIEQRSLDDNSVYILGHELARDLLTIPALTQDSSVLLKTESAKLYLWDQMFYIKKSGRQALEFALKHCGLTDTGFDAIKQEFENIFSIQKDVYIFHELGEIKDTVFDRRIWREIIGAFPHTTVELFARSVKDLLADTSKDGTLSHIIRERNSACLGFYAAFFDGLAKTLFPEFKPAFDQFAQSSDWQIIEHAVSKCFLTAKQYAEQMMAMYFQGKENHNMKWVEKEIETRLISRCLNSPHNDGN